MSVLTSSNLIDVISNCKAFYTSQRRVSPPHSATMTVYARVARTAGRTAVRAQRRQMGGSHAPAPEWTGIDKVVRGYFPEDYQREFYRKHGSYRLLASPTRGSRYKNTDTTNGDENRRQRRWLEEACLVGRSKCSATVTSLMAEANSEGELLVITKKYRQMCAFSIIALADSLTRPGP